MACRQIGDAALLGLPGEQTGWPPQIQHVSYVYLFGRDRREVRNARGTESRDPAPSEIRTAPPEQAQPASDPIE